MNNIIIRETASEMRAIARKSLSGNWMTVAIAMGVYYLLMITVPLLFDELIPGAPTGFVDELSGEELTMPVVSTLYSLVLTGPLTAGMASLCLSYFRHKDANPGHLFDGFEYFLKSVILTIMVVFYTLLWSLLFFIPGIIAGFRYSQAFYILADHPEYSPSQCIRLSKAYMAGNKMKLFCFELSFIGWVLLTALAAVPLAFIPLSGVGAVIGDFIVAIPNFFLLAYNGIGCIVFYELVSGNLMARPAAEAFMQAGESMGTVTVPTYIEPGKEREMMENPAESKQEKTEDDDEFNF